MTDHTGSFSSLSFEKNTPGKWDIAWGVLFLYREPFDQCGGYFDFYGVGDGGFDLPDQLGGGCLSHEFSGDVDGGEGGVYDAAFGDVVEACDGDIFGNLVAAEFQGLDGADGDEVVVCEVCAGKRGSAVYDLQHVGECALNRWRKLMNNRFSGGHSMFADCPVKTVCPFAKVSDSVGRAEMSRLAAAAVDEITGGQISTLRIVAQYTAAVSRIEIGIQKNYRN